MRRVSGCGEEDDLVFTFQVGEVQDELCLGDHRFPSRSPARRPSLPLLPPSRSIQEVWDPTDRGAGVAAVEAPGRRSSPTRDARRSLTHTHEVALQPRRRPARGATGKSRPGPGAGGGVGASGSPGRAGLAPQRAGGEGLFPRGGGGVGGERRNRAGREGRGPRRAASVRLLKIFH